MYKRYNKINIQSHYLLADRIDGMLHALYSINKPSEEQQAAIKALKEQSLSHQHQAMMTGDKFIMLT
jgi:hypothetical protein